jgi:alkanesulfonate monooxygenase SsuD/methylene tetrahydromethanopterin reductase-like flavin-dependent oxidoreductase (luciferase family)
MMYTFGLDTFGDRNSDADGKPLSHAQTIRNVMDEGVFAEQAGVDFFGIGEHHTDYFPMPAGDVVLAAIAARTERIRLGSAVTVLSSDDPVRVFQRYSTLNAISGGRAEVILGRGSSIESFPLFGYDLADYEELFEEKATLFGELLKGGPVTWDGKTRAPLLSQDVVPHTEFGPFPAWIGVGGSPQSVVRAARLGFSLMLAIIGGPPARFAAYSELFQRALEKCTRAAPGGRALAGPRRGQRRAGEGGVLAALAGHHRPRRPGTRLRDPHRGVVRLGNRAARGALRRLARNGRPEDRHQPPRPRRHPVRPEVRHARPDPRPAHDQYPALRSPGHPARPRAAQPASGRPAVATPAKLIYGQVHARARARTRGSRVAT